VPESGVSMSRSLRGHGERGKLKGSRARFIPTAGGQSRSPLQIPNLFRHSLKLTGDFCRCLLQSDSPPVGPSGFQIPDCMCVDCERLFLNGEFLESLCVVLMPPYYRRHFPVSHAVPEFTLSEPLRFASPVGGTRTHTPDNFISSLLRRTTSDG